MAKQAKNSRRGSKPGERRGGRQTGTPNKATTAAREAIAAFVDANAERLQGWLDKIAKSEPEKAFRMVMDVVEYHVPKLARTEVTGSDGGPIIFKQSSEDERI